MLQVKNGTSNSFVIKSIRKRDDKERPSTGTVCSLEAGDGSDKPPC